MILNPISTALFEFGLSVLYQPQDGKHRTCQAFIDIGWREPTSGYDSYPAEHMTLISVLLQEIPNPRTDDRIVVGDKQYEVVAIQAQDDVIAVLNVRAL